jgi:hypothetical protein
MFNQKLFVMKKILFLSMVLAGVLSINQKANAFAKGSATVLRSPWQDSKTKIKKEDLPEPIRKKLNEDAYKGWVIVNASKLGNGDYEVELKKNDTTQVLKFDKDGNVKE